MDARPRTETVILKQLLGRRREYEAVRLLLDCAHGQSGVLVLRGEAGIGKTAILELARDLGAEQFQVVSASGVESETEFAFAGLHQLCAPLLRHADILSDPQREALLVALGRQTGPAPDLFLVGLAVLNLWSDAADEQPLLCVVDDVQWFDQASAQVLAFVARRLSAERVALLFGRRETEGDNHDLFRGLAEIHVGRLSDAESRQLLETVTNVTMDKSVRDQIIAEARGNPLALLELPRSARPERLAGGYALPYVAGVPRRIEDSFRRRSRDLPPDTQELLLIAAAEPTGDPALLERAAARLDLDVQAAVAAESAGLLEIGPARVRFAHPLVRSAVYQAANPQDHRRVHRALAEATVASDPDRRAWHRAQAVQGVDEQVAAELEASAVRARSRGGLAAAAAFLQGAAELTPDPVLRAKRSLAAALAKYEAGSFDEARRLIGVAVDVNLEPLDRARAVLLRTRMDYQEARHSSPPKALLAVAAGLAPLDPVLSRETYLDALDGAIVTGGVEPGWGPRVAAEAALNAPPAPTPPQLADLLLDGLTTMYTQGYEASVPELRRALDAMVALEPSADLDGSRRWLGLASRTAIALFDDDLVNALADRHVALAREAGALATLPTALLIQSLMAVLSGDLARAELVAGQTSILAPSRALPQLHAHLILAAWRGATEEASELRASLERGSEGPAQRTERLMTTYAMSVLHNGHRDYAAALEVALQSFQASELSHGSLPHTELVEAACRQGRPELAAEALAELTARAQASGTSWGLGLAARSRALVSSGSEAEALYREAIEHLAKPRTAGHLARAHLLYGEWLRREGRRQDAREQLRTAHRMLAEMGAAGFAERAARELRATGEHPRRRDAQAADALTEQELQVARLVATGATSKEVGAALFLSPRTIEAHLRNIFRKLGITSRRQLAEVKLS
ncbi:ATP-binding protein [Nocardioides pantholopis]|uniref:ATP-binding protein n=1 Tax=Nocardioides pantholopis TaxID=2483798 RepID=UPI00295E5A14|nr:AAA family ATPase [Nocardioides pantholopis]